MLFDMNKCPPALLLYFVSDRYEASMCPARTMSLALCVILASGCVWLHILIICFSFFIVCSAGFDFCAEMDPSAVSKVGLTARA